MLKRNYNATILTILVPNEDILEEDERRLSDDNGKYYTWYYTSSYSENACLYLALYSQTPTW